MPENITLPHLPPYGPERDTVESIWRFPRHNKSGNRVFDTCEAIVDACRKAWNALTDSPHPVHRDPAVERSGDLFGRGKRGDRKSPRRITVYRAASVRVPIGAWTPPR